MLRYVLGAWEMVKTSPVWEDSVHNKYRHSCFRCLGKPSSIENILILYFAPHTLY